MFCPKQIMIPKISIPVYVSPWHRLSELGYEAPHNVANSNGILESELSLFLKGMHPHIIRVNGVREDGELCEYGSHTAAFESGLYSPPESVDHDVTSADVFERDCTPTRRFADGPSTPAGISMDNVASIVTPKVIVLPSAFQAEKIRHRSKHRDSRRRISVPHNLCVSLPGRPISRIPRIKIHGSQTGSSATTELPTPYSLTCLQ